MDEPDLENGDLIIGHVAVYRIIEADGTMRDLVLSDDGHGQELDLPTAVGMLAVGQHTMLCDFEPDDS